MSKNILVAPLNWGLGHATRCIPIIRELEVSGYNPILASDGVALALLKKEFPHLKILELPSYNIRYAKKGQNFKWKQFRNSPKIFGAMLEEKKLTKQWVKNYKLDGIISDNRLGVRSKKVPSVFITHQLNVLTGNTTWITSKLHQMVINKFTECWVPDNQKTPNLTGKLGHLKSPNTKIKYIGPLSRLEKSETPIIYKLMVILSGPEPQRGMLEEILKIETAKFDGKVLFVAGRIEPEQEVIEIGNTTFYNFMNAADLQIAFNQSEIVLCRSGYTTVMDLAKLGKKAFFIPTPGQFEQEYLAKKLQKDGLVPFAKQNDFKIENLIQVNLYKGFNSFNEKINFKKLFAIFG